ncbi:MAG: site-specific integrase [Acidobacteriia bacterium]|nr:site-specific integrase [Terriglobia bacterium]
MARKAGQLISRGSRTWLVRVSLGRDPETGTRKYHNKTIRGSFREAQTYLSGRLQEREIGRLPRAAATSLNQYLDQWLTTVAKPKLRPKSYIDYEALLRLHIRPVLGTRPLGAIVQFDIQSIYAQMFARGLSARTIEYTNAVLQSVFRQAVRWKMLGEDPCIGVDLPRIKRREMEALSVEECRRFLAATKETEWFALYALALTTGMRPSEYLALKWSDIDWQRGAASVCRTIQHSKTGRLFDDTKRKRSRRVPGLFLRRPRGWAFGVCLVVMEPQSAHYRTVPITLPFGSGFTTAATSQLSSAIGTKLDEGFGTLCSIILDSLS